MKPEKLFVITVIAVLTLTLSITPAFSLPDQASPKTQEMTEFRVPEHAKEIAPGIFSLGKFEFNGVVLEGMMAYHHRPNHSGGPGGGDSNDGDDTIDSSSCYSYLWGKEIPWRTAEPWIVNPSNNKGLSSSQIMNALNAGVTEWELHAGKDNVLGSGSTTDATLVADYRSTDGLNEIYFADIRNSDGSLNDSILGVTVTWAVVRGPPSSLGIVEMDQVYDDYDFNWSTDLSTGTFDFGHVATHEIGHGVGMGHTEVTELCNQETMYPYAAPEDNSGQDLHDGDINGIKRLY